MEAILNIVKELYGNYGTCPETMENTRGFYAKVGDETRWIRIETNYSGNDLESSEMAVRVNEKRVIPVFSHLNFRDNNVNWPSLYYPSISKYSRDMYRLAAVLFHIIMVHTMRDRGLRIPSENDFVEAARIYKQSVQGETKMAMSLLDELLSPKLDMESDRPWNERIVYRRIGLRRSIHGAQIDLSERKDSEGNEICDFEDVFAALVDVMDFMRCPTPLMILNRSDTSYLKREDPDMLVGRIGPLEMEVQSSLVLRTANKDKKQDVQKYVTIVVNKLVEHGIISPDLHSVHYLTEAVLYFESALEIEPIDLYITAILCPRTLFKHFYYNEMTRCALGKSNDVLYYSDDAYTTHVHLHRLVPKQKTLVFKLRSSYSITIECTENGQLEMFEKHLKQVIYMYKHRYADVQKFSVLEKRNPVVMVPPELGQYTRQHTSKRHGSQRAVSQVDHPFYISPSFSNSPEFALRIAQTISHIHHQRLNDVYVSSGLAMVKITEFANFEAMSNEMDSFSAFYVSLLMDVPVENFSEDGLTVRPGASRNRSQLQTSVQTPAFNGLPKERMWSCRPLYSEMYKMSDDKDLISAIEIATQSQGRWQSDLTPAKLRNLAPVAKPELFDMSIDEILETMSFDGRGKPQMDSTIHFRILELVYKCTIVTLLSGESPRARIHANTTLVMESTRKSGLSIRNLERDTHPLVLILKYFSNGWNYVPIFHAERLTSTRVFRQATVGNAHQITDPALRREVLDSLAGSGCALFDPFQRREVRPVIDTTYLTIAYTVGFDAVMSQSIDTDGYTTSLTIKTTHRTFAALLCKLCRSGDKPDTLGSTEIVVTLELANRAPPVPVPVSDEHFSLSANEIEVFKPYLLSSHVGAPLELGSTLLYKVGPSSSMCLVLFAVGEKVLPKVPSSTLAYLNQMTVLMSLFHWTVLNASTVEADETYQCCMAILNHSKRVPIGTEVAVKDRFPRPVLAGVRAANAFALQLGIYFREFMPVTDSLLQSLFEYFSVEMAWMVRWQPPVNSVRYISGIHTFVPSNRLRPSIDDSERFFPAAAGKSSIVKTWKEYEFAVIRNSARRHMTSCTTFIDMSSSTSAAYEMNKTAFVKKLPSGAVAYAYAADSQSDAYNVLRTRSMHKSMGTSAPKIMGYDHFTRATFAHSQSIVYCTSSNEAQGSWYWMDIFVPQQEFTQ